MLRSCHAGRRAQASQLSQVPIGKDRRGSQSANVGRADVVLRQMRAHLEPVRGSGTICEATQNLLGAIYLIVATRKNRSGSSVHNLIVFDVNPIRIAADNTSEDGKK